MDLLASGYGSGSDSDSEERTQQRDDQQKGQQGDGSSGGIQLQGRQGDEDDDSDEESSDESVDSAALRAAEAAARLRDYGEGRSTATSGRGGGAGGGAGKGTSLLPSAMDVFGQVDRPPTFLDPEAIRPLAAAPTHGLSAEQLAAAAAAGAGQLGKPRQRPGKDFDISVLAPPLKGQAKSGGDKRDAPAGAVIEGKAKRYKQEEGPEATQTYTAAQIAMMGGKVGPVRPAGEDDESGGGGPKRVATGAMAVTEFLDKGLGAAQLPRKAQDRKEKEKSKRMKGQSTHAHWKSEAEMVLRQQFDS